MRACTASVYASISVSLFFSSNKKNPTTKPLQWILYVPIGLGNITKCLHCIIQNDIFLLHGLAALCMKYKQMLSHWTILNSQKQKGPPATPPTSLHFIGRRSDATKMRLYMDSELLLQGFHFRYRNWRVRKSFWACCLHGELLCFYLWIWTSLCCTRSRLGVTCFASAQRHILKWCLINSIFPLCRNNMLR